MTKNTLMITAHDQQGNYEQQGNYVPPYLSELLMLFIIIIPELSSHPDELT